jgi:small subunit ribosomal protein S5
MPETVAARRGLPVEHVAPAALLKAQAEGEATAAAAKTSAPEAVTA